MIKISSFRIVPSNIQKSVSGYRPTIKNLSCTIAELADNMSFDADEVYSIRHRAYLDSMRPFCSKFIKDRGIKYRSSIPQKI